MLISALPVYSYEHVRIYIFKDKSRIEKHMMISFFISGCFLDFQFKSVYIPYINYFVEYLRFLLFFCLLNIRNYIHTYICVIYFKNFISYFRTYLICFLNSLINFEKQNHKSHNLNFHLRIIARLHSVNFISSITSVSTFVIPDSR